MHPTKPLSAAYRNRMKNMYLRNEVRVVSGKKGGKTSCLQEMTRLLDCLNANEFEDVKCLEERNVFLACGRERILLKERGELKIGRPGEMSGMDVNRMLKKRFKYL